MSGGGDPLKGGFLRGPKRGDVALTDAEAAAAKIKVKVNKGIGVMARVCTCRSLRSACLLQPRSASDVLTGAATANLPVAGAAISEPHYMCAAAAEIPVFTDNVPTPAEEARAAGLPAKAQCAEGEEPQALMMQPASNSADGCQSSSVLVAHVANRNTNAFIHLTVLQLLGRYRSNAICCSILLQSHISAAVARPRPRSCCLGGFTAQASHGASPELAIPLDGHAVPPLLRLSLQAHSKS